MTHAVSRRGFVASLLASATVTSAHAAWQFRVQAPVNLGPPPATTMPTLAPQYFTAANNISPEMLRAQPQEPIKLFGGGAYLGKMVAKLDTPNRIRVPAFTKYPAVCGVGNLDTYLGPNQAWFRRGIGYLIGDTDSAGIALTDADYAAGKGVVSTVTTDLIKYSRTTDLGTFFSCGFGVMLDNTNPTPNDRRAYFTMVVEPQNGYARRTELICIVFEGASSAGTIGATGVTFRDNDVFVSSAAYDASLGIDDTTAAGVLANGNFQAGAGTQASPYTNINYALAMAAKKMGVPIPVTTPNGDFTPTSPVATVWVDCSGGPALLDYSAYAYRGYGYDHIIVKPWPGKSTRGQMKRSGFGHLDHTSKSQGGMYMAEKMAYLAYNRVIFQDFDIDMSNIQAFSNYGFYPSFVAGPSIGFVNPRFSISDFDGDCSWQGQGHDCIVDSGLNNFNSTLNLLKPIKEPYGAFIINGTGRVGSMAGMTLINGGHFRISWDAFYIDGAMNSWAFFDSVVRQDADLVDPAHGNYPVPVAEVYPDPVGQRTVVKLADEVWPGVAKYAITGNVVTVYCYAADGKTPMIPPFQTAAMPFNPGVGVAPTMTFPASDPVLGGLVLTLTGFDAMGVSTGRGYVFTAALPSGVTKANTSGLQGPFGFTYNSAQARTVKGVSQEGFFASIASGPAKSVMLDTDGFVSGNTGAGEPDFNTPDYVATYATPTGLLSMVSASCGRPGTPGAGQIISPLRYGTAYQPQGALSGNTITFKGTVIAFGAASNGLTTTTNARGKLATFAGSLTIPSAFTNGLVWGMSVRDSNGRTLGRIAQAGVNMSPTTATVDSTTAGNPVVLPPNSFYIEGWDGGSDLNGAAWEVSFDLHGLTVYNDLTAINDDTNRYPITAVNGSVVILGNNVGGTAPAPSSSTITTWQESNSVTSKHVVLVERYWDYFGNAKARKTSTLGAGDLFRYSNSVQHNDAWQIPFNWYQCEKMENCLWQHARWVGFNLQMAQQQGQTPNYFGVGTLTTHAAGDGYGQNDGKDLNFTLPALVMTEPGAAATAADFWIDGIKYPSYAIATDVSKFRNADGTFSQYLLINQAYYYRLIDSTGANTTGWTDANGNTVAAQTGYMQPTKHPKNADITLFPWTDRRRHIRLKFLTQYGSTTFRVGRIVIANTLKTVLLLDDKGAVSGSTLAAGFGDTFQQPLPLDANSLITVAKAGGSQSRVFTPNPDSPGTGRVDRPFYGSDYVGQNIISVTMSAYQTATPAAQATIVNWYIPLQITDTVRVSCIFGTGLTGQRYSGLAPGGGIEQGIGWNGVGNVQTTEGMPARIPARIGFPGTDMFSSLFPKRGTVNNWGQLDSVYGGLAFGQPNAFTLGDALFRNSYFGKMGAAASLASLIQNTNVPSADQVTEDNFKNVLGCKWEFPVVSFVDPDTGRPQSGVNYGGLRMRAGLGAPRWPWAADGSLLPTDGSALVGGIQPA